MTITKNAGRQCEDVAYVDVEYSDLTSGVAEGAVELPPGAVITGGKLVKSTAFDSATSDSLIVGDADDDDRYLTANDLQSAGISALTATGHEHTGGDVTVTWTGAGTAPTAGKFTLAVHYYVRGRAQTTYG